MQMQRRDRLAEGQFPVPVWGKSVDPAENIELFLPVRRRIVESSA
jgi:hypothetical protein